MDTKSFMLANVLRTAIFSILTFVSILIYALFLPICVFSYRFSKKAAICWTGCIFFLTKHIAKIHTNVTNEKIAENAKGIIVVSNHCSAWETFFIAYYFKIPIFILKKSLFKLPVLGYMLKTLNMVGIDRSSYNKSTKQTILNNINQAAKQGRNISIFPQGTRVPIAHTYNYKKYPYKPGITTFCRGKKVLTFSTDARKCFGKSLFSLKKKGSVNVYFNEVLTISQEANKNDIVLQIRNSIENGCKQIKI